MIFKRNLLILQGRSGFTSYFRNINLIVMDLNRRGFFKILGVTSVTLAVGNESKAVTKPESKTEFSAVLYDSTRCIGCQTCEFACAEANGLPNPDGTPQAGIIRKTDESHRTVVNTFASSKGEAFLKKQCMHCNEPACAAACLTQAMYKTKEGPVLWRGEKCMGCRYCMISCPFDAPKFEFHSSNPKIEKCNMCYSRLTEGKIPSCVENCPAEALVFGTRRELLTEARKRVVEKPDQYFDHIYGEHEAGGTGFLCLAAVPFNELGMNASIQTESFPSLSKGFLYSVPSIFVLWPAILLGIREATKNNKQETEEDEQY
jgi:formate dehydrogenase iron-sulfur subunit